MITNSFFNSAVLYLILCTLIGISITLYQINKKMKP